MANETKEDELAPGSKAGPSLEKNKPTKGQIIQRNNGFFYKFDGKQWRRVCKCGIRPNFNFEGESTAICCSECKEPGMIDVKNPRCKCGKSRPYFNFEGESTAICCSKCKEQGMIDVKNRRCKCGKRPTFNFEGKSKALCVRHSERREEKTGGGAKRQVPVVQ